MDRTYIDRYEAGATIPAKAIVGLSREQLNALPVPGTWSIQQIVVHLWESDATALHRMRRIIAEDKPLIIAYDETAMAKSLFYEDEDLARVCRMFEDGRHMMARVLRRLPDDTFERCCIHNHNGKVTLARMVEMYVNHLSGHMEHLIRKRAMVGAPLELPVP
ncbi:MAG: DinB family protein [Phycisphaerales bacterium]